MDQPPPSRIEDWSVGGYAALASACLLLSAAALSIDAPYVGIFVAFWLVGLTVFAAILLAIVIVAINAKRAVRGADADRVAVAYALLIPAALVGAGSVAVADVSMAMFLVVGLVALVLAPLGVGYRVFDDRIRDRFRGPSVESVE